MSYQRCSDPIVLRPAATVSNGIRDSSSGSGTHGLAKIDLDQQKRQVKENGEQYDDECSISVGALWHKSKI